MALTSERCSSPGYRSHARWERSTLAIRVLLSLLQACHQLVALGILQAHLHNSERHWPDWCANSSQSQQPVEWRRDATAPREWWESREHERRLEVRRYRRAWCIAG